MRGIKQLIWIIVPIFFMLISFEQLMAQIKNYDEAIVQAKISLTVSESKSLIAKAVVKMPIVKKAIIS